MSYPGTFLTRTSFGRVRLRYTGGTEADNLNTQLDKFINVYNGTEATDALFNGSLGCKGLYPHADSTYSLGDTSYDWTALYLDNAATDGGAIYFDSGTTEFLKADADGTGLKVGGFDELSPNAAATTDLGNATTPFKHLHLNNSTTNGGAIYFDGGTTTKYLRCNAGGTELSTDLKYLIGTNSNTTDFSGTQTIISNGDSGYTNSNYMGLVSESFSTGASSRGILGVAKVDGALGAYGVSGIATQSNGVAGTCYGLLGNATTGNAFAGSVNYGVYSDASGAATNYSFYGNTGTLYNTGVTLIGTDASTTDFPYAKAIVSQANSGITLSANLGVVGEGVADGTYAGIGINGCARTSSANDARGVDGRATVAAATDATSAYGGYFTSTSTHTGGNNVAIYANAANASGSGVNYSYYGAGGVLYNVGDIDSGEDLNAVGNVTAGLDIYTTPYTDYFSSSTITGWTSPAGNIYYKKVGKLVFVNYYIYGTSNAITVSFTVPFTSANVGVSSSFNYYSAAAITDSSSPLTTPGKSSLSMNSNVVNVYTDWNVGVFTATGTKVVRGQFWYEAA